VAGHVSDDDLDGGRDRLDLCRLGDADRERSGRRVEIRTIVELFRGDLPLGRAFWVQGILGGGAVSLLYTLLP
jgi:hypothetical protein